MTSKFIFPIKVNSHISVFLKLYVILRQCVKSLFSAEINFVNGLLIKGTLILQIDTKLWIMNDSKKKRFY